VGEEFLLCGLPILVSGVGSLSDLITEPYFGSHWNGCSFEEKSQLLLNDFLKSWEESDKDRLLRSQRAGAKFSLATMGQQLKKMYLS
jgi:glycosyltransferase involved in cell wall biosynthesis